jgi:hypothetical protein
VNTTGAAYLSPTSISNLFGLLLGEINITKVSGSSGTVITAYSCFLVDINLLNVRLHIRKKEELGSLNHDMNVNMHLMHLIISW